MRMLIEILASLAILANAVIYRTDVFGAIVLRPAIAVVDDRTLTQLLGHIHRIADWSPLAHHDAESSDLPTGRNK
jgi:hypothetical protein